MLNRMGPEGVAACGRLLKLCGSEILASVPFGLAVRETGLGVETIMRARNEARKQIWG